MNKYLLHGKLTAKQGHRDELASILIDASKLVSTAKGCKIYVIGLDKDDINSVYVTEIWDSKEDHDNSLNVKGVKELITKAIPILDGKPSTGQELKVLGGAGVQTNLPATNKGLCPARENNQLKRSFKFKDFAEYFTFITEVAFAAEKMSYQPNWNNVCNKVDILLLTHEAKKSFTEKDLKLSKETDRIYKNK